MVFAPSGCPQVPNITKNDTAGKAQRAYEALVFKTRRNTRNRERILIRTSHELATYRMWNERIVIDKQSAVQGRLCLFYADRVTVDKNRQWSLGFD